MKKSQICITEKGFTMTEILVVVAITALLTATLIVYSKTGERQLALYRDQSRIIAALFRAKSLAINTYGETKIPCGYGVHFDSSGSFWIFQDLSMDTCASANHVYNEGELVESFNLVNGISFSSINLTDVVFIPPDPSVIITDNNGNNPEEANISLNAAGGDNFAGIKITNSGQISGE
ncbi:prepilin-type N-terminal cleavage/methylation domain-containing protein [Candidatus Wolfebacteria bacterium]|nr:prepilin-type N-terminal cleavage/methylation domain-containing protein [Candidatus Wolfebacteria bacterium]